MTAMLHSDIPTPSESEFDLVTGGAETFMGVAIVLTALGLKNVEEIAALNA